MTLIIVEPATHKRLWRFRIDHDLKSHDEVVEFLLDRVENEQRKKAN